MYWKLKPAAPLPLSPARITVNAMTITSTLDRTLLSPVAEYLSSSLVPAYIPTEFTLTETPNTKIPTFVGSWEKNTKKFSLMVWLTMDKTNISYIRVWTLDPLETLNQESAVKLVKLIAKESYLNNIPKPECSIAPSKDDANTLRTQCATLKIRDNLDMLGVTVRSPVIYKPSNNDAKADDAKIATSLCLVPKEGITMYPGKSCL
ncbi:hypothetical protein HY947_00365 [Candidatus Gottesmanbacteria bacterium]|nr:hypothetical protein [Candidatus Gottesmanbacteria bacterium]